MDFDFVKENVQPLQSGRRIDSLASALSMDPNETRRRDEAKMAFENQLKSTNGEERFQVYYNYILWIEQNYPQGGKEANLKDITEKCIFEFYKVPEFQNNEKLLSIFLKYANTTEKPIELFRILYKRGFGKRLAQFFIEWSYYYENQDNFKKALDSLKAGIHHNAQPIGDLQNKLNDLQIRTMRHVIANPDAAENESAATQRKALNNLKMKMTHGKADAPVHRGAGSIISNSGLKNNADNSASGSSKNGAITNAAAAPLNVLRDEIEELTNLETITPITSSLKPTSVENRENERDPGKWSENKLKKKALRPRPIASSFEILEDGNDEVKPPPPPPPPPRPPVSAPPKPKSAKPIPVAKFEEAEKLKRYIWYGLMSQMYRDNTEYSFEEIRAQKWHAERLKREKNEEEGEEEEASKDSTRDEEQSSVSRFVDCSQADHEHTSMIRNFYDGTLRLMTTYDNDQTTTQLIPENQSICRAKEEIRAPEKFEIFSDTCENFDDCTANQTEVLNGHFKTKLFDNTITGLRDEQFAPCSGSTQSIDRLANFAFPPIAAKANRINLYGQPSYVTGITAKLSPIIETSRDGLSSKSSSSSSGMSSCVSRNGSVYFSETINPFGASLKNRLLNSLSDPIDLRKGFASLSCTLPDLSPIGTPITLNHGKRYVPLGCIAQIGKRVSMFAVYQCDTDQFDDPDGRHITLHSAKRCDDRSSWDFYIRDELQRRFLRTIDRSRNFSLSIMPMYETIFFNNGYIALHNDGMTSNLREALDFYRQTGQTFPEILIKYFMLELMLIIQKFHDCKIIHANVCAENIFLFHVLPAKECLGKQIEVLRFSDFSDAIDMSVLPDGTFFSKNFTKNESMTILNTKNWTHLIDWLGFVNCVHQMYFESEMKLVCENKRWATMKRFELPDRQHMNELFGELLNLEVNQKPNIDAFIEDLQKSVTEAYADLVAEFSFFSLHLSNRIIIN